ncbi:TetR/AcrR family transcriptional regulator [Bacillus pacificus]|uniref:TetR/AcrR family transcriptional regulator n=1 Tax=Bacillus cereus group TaxID=86661 RepID=UPI000BEC36FC|nr:MULTISPECIES: TetR/AcrR family transcriptional regulator [Bacillus cereus group]PDY94569.1 TetR family transcriptional regulator [Bacillus anthracis]MDA1776665.1 TetR/AcrR family transcriptional regulator [Bacillus cereus group sp. BY9-3LC]MDA1806767.1 TetR/AcrR family transcriptional regulator [Bacillus cereus group sp. BY32LC]PES23690.1 TetR family transcriptional regulator [Bacillus anthracis]PFB59331.1 TetR family transcriptional regulator [Bacillus anthracis]
MGKLTAREKVMEAATLLFGEKGYTATTIREVAEKAGVSELTIFRNFKNKENLFRESIILRTTPVALLEEIEEQFTGDLQKDLTKVAETYIQTNLPKLNYIWAALIESRQNSEMKTLLHELNSHLVNHLEKYLKQLGEAGHISPCNYRLIANMFYGQLFLYIMNVSITEEEIQLEEYIETCVNLFMNGISNKENE